MTSSGAIVLVVAAILIGLVLLRFARQIALFLLRMGLAGGTVLLVVALLGQMPNAMQTQAVSDYWPMALAAVLSVFLLAAVVVIGYLVLRLRIERRRWLPGPDARWGQTSGPRWEENPLAPYPPLPHGLPYPQQQYPSPQVLPTFYILEDPGDDETEDVPWEDVWW